MSRFERGRTTALVVVESGKKEGVTAEDAVQTRMRYTMPMKAMDNIQLAGLVASSRLLDMLTDEQTFEGLRPSDRLKAIELSMTQAFGRVTTAEEARKAAPEADALKTISLREKLVALGKVVDLPELNKKKV